MPWTITLEDEVGEVIQTLTEFFDYGELHTLNLNQFKLLRYIDPYGDTVFNCLQINDLIDDFEKLKDISKQTSIIDKIIELGRRSENEVHTYIKFYGD
jgi:hypothetical protein